MREPQLDAYDEGAVERPTIVDESIARRDEIIRQAEGARVGAAWLIENAAELAALRVGVDFQNGTLLSKVGGDFMEFFVFGEDQTARFVDAVSLLPDPITISSGERFVDVAAKVEDTGYRIKFMFDRKAIDEDALNSAEGKV